jgi:hypothetical protein
MKTYPSISREVPSGLSVYAFSKLDGSNVRAEWTRKQGICKIGSRKRLLGSDQGILVRAEALIREQEVELAAIAKENRWDKLTLFFEFLGPSSFAGNHVEGEQQSVYLIDVAPHKQGIMPPREFCKTFEGRVPTAPLLYHGPCDGEFVESVRAGTLEGMPFEGVVCKTSQGRHKLVMFKIKSRAWLERLKEHCQGDERLFEQLR